MHHSDTLEVDFQALVLIKRIQSAVTPYQYNYVVSLCVGLDSPEDLCILYSNRAACYLKDGNSQDCIQDCTR